MTLNDFLYVYKYPLSKLKLTGVKLLKDDTNDNGRDYYHFNGLFECQLPAPFLEIKDDNKDKILKELNELKDEFSIEHKKKFTKKVFQDGKMSKWTFVYTFDFAPNNIVMYDMDKDKEILTLQVLGYGQFG